MTTDHDLEAIRKEQAVYESNPPANVAHAYNMAMKRCAALLSMLSTRAVTQPTKHALTDFMFEWLEDHFTKNGKVHSASPRLRDTASIHASGHLRVDMLASAILALPGLSLPQGSVMRAEIERWRNDAFENAALIVERFPASINPNVPTMAEYIRRCKHAAPPAEGSAG